MYVKSIAFYQRKNMYSVAFSLIVELIFTCDFLWAAFQMTCASCSSSILLCYTLVGTPFTSLSSHIIQVKTKRLILGLGFFFICKHIISAGMCS